MVDGRDRASTPPRAAWSPVSLERATTSERAAEALRTAMFAGQLRPGDALREVELADRLSISRGSVREALLRLTAEGLLTRTAFYGVQVKSLTQEEVRDAFLTRRVLELSGVEATRTAAPINLTKLESATSACVTVIQTGGPEEQTQADLNVHRAVVGLLGSPRMTEIHNGILDELRVTIAGTYSTGAPVDHMAGHLEFQRLIRLGEIEAARSQLEERLREAEQRVLADLPSVTKSKRP